MGTLTGKPQPQSSSSACKEAFIKHSWGPSLTDTSRAPVSVNPEIVQGLSGRRSGLCTKQQRWMTAQRQAQHAWKLQLCLSVTEPSRMGFSVPSSPSKLKINLTVSRKGKGAFSDSKKKNESELLTAKLVAGEAPGKLGIGFDHSRFPLPTGRHQRGPCR